MFISRHHIRLVTLCALASLCLLVAPLLHAKVTRIEIVERGRLASGQEFGTHGAYEEVSGVVHFSVDPDDPHNQVIADLALAPVNSAGMIEFSADFAVWKPVDMRLGNGVTLLDVPNRGGRVATSFNRPTAGSPLGDAFLLFEGYTIVWVGWEYDLPDAAALRIDVPEIPTLAATAVAELTDIAVAGLGFAAVRDMASWIRFEEGALFNTPHMLGFGLSQSGRFLRTFLYLGFNEDVQGRQVFGGMMPHIAGASRLDLNRRGAEPASQAQFSATAFPFTDAVYFDPVSGAEDGLLDNARARGTMPKLFYTNSGAEYWGGGRVAALTHTMPDGSADIPLLNNVRQYYLAGTQHVPGGFPPAAPANGQQPGNPLDYWWNLRALLTALKDWVVHDSTPPPSRYPLLAEGTLVAPLNVDFPAIAGVHAVSGLSAGLRVANPLLSGNGGQGSPLPLLVPQVNEDGNDVAGLRHPELVVPLATYTGWNFTNPQRGDPDSLYPLAGSYIPFAATRAERAANNDPRLSIEERYADKEDFLRQVEQACDAQIAAHYLLPDDVGAILERAEAHWDLLMEGK